jgi:hypothetical protein
MCSNGCILDKIKKIPYNLPSREVENRVCLVGLLLWLFGLISHTPNQKTDPPNALIAKAAPTYG